MNTVTVFVEGTMAIKGVLIFGKMRAALDLTFLPKCLFQSHRIRSSLAATTGEAIFTQGPSSKGDKSFSLAVTKKKHIRAKSLATSINNKGTYVEGIKEEVVLSPAHALSLIAAGEGNTDKLVMISHGGLLHFFFCLKQNHF
eukprot:Gb_35640 [translate_table: standard]